LTWLSAKVHPFYFVTFNTWERAPLLANDEVHAAFQQFCLKAQEHYIAVGRYVLMPDHIHLFVMLPTEGTTLTRWIRALRTVLGKRILALGNDNPHWQDGFFDHLLRTSESYAGKWEYVRQNQVRAGLCQEPEGWPFQGEIVPIEFR
jgi:putative transposase